MIEQPRYDPYGRSEFFADGRMMRDPPEGAVQYRAPALEPELQAGIVNGEFVDTIPINVTRQLVERGRDRYDRFCGPCHGVLGTGETVVAIHMQRRPPSLHERRIRDQPDGRIFHVINAGYGYMSDYRAQLRWDERWAVVAYVRALQRSQHALVAELPEFVREELRRTLR
jgi:mono/diheme cytochrome c family protein